MSRPDTVATMALADPPQTLDQYGGTLPTTQKLPFPPAVSSAAMVAAYRDFPGIVAEALAACEDSKAKQNVISSAKAPVREYVLKVEGEPDDPFPRRDARFATQADLFEIQRGCSWGADEIDYKTDLKCVPNMGVADKELLQLLIAFFVRADKIVADNLIENFQKESAGLDLQAWFAMQAVVELIHTDSYAQQFDVVTTGESSERKKWLLEVHENIPSIKKKIEWMKRWTHGEGPFAMRVLALLATEGIFFASAFALIFYYRASGTIPGIMGANDFIARDERLHCELACSIYQEHILNKLPPEIVKQIFQEAADAEIAFVREMAGTEGTAPLGAGLPHSNWNGGMVCKAIEEHILYVMRYWLNELGIRVPGGVGKSPLLWLDKGGQEVKSNFFEGRSTSYGSMSHAITKAQKAETLRRALAATPPTKEDAEETKRLLTEFAEAHAAGEWGSMKGTPLEVLLEKELKVHKAGGQPRYKQVKLGNTYTEHSGPRPAFTTSEDF